MEKLQDSVIAKARGGQLPSDLEAKMRTMNEEQQAAAFREYLSEKIEADPELKQLSDRYAALSEVVSVALQLGSLQVRRANAVQGAEREQLLAAAEKAFLAVRSEGAGIPAYHLGLGVVYYRLDKREEGEQEFAALLDNPDLQVRLNVARAYRDLGLVGRAAR